MCMICVEFQKGMLTIREARFNLAESSESLTPEHVKELKKLLNKAEEDQIEEAHP